MTQADNVGKKIKDYFKEKGITQVEDAIFTKFLEKLKKRKITQNQNLEFED